MSWFEHYLLRLCCIKIVASQPLMMMKEMWVSMMLCKSEFQLKREMKLDLHCNLPLLSTELKKISNTQV